MPARAALVVLGCLVCQLGAGFFYATRALSPDLIQELGWTRTMWSSAMTPMLLVSSLAQAVVGTACIRFGVRAVLLASLACLLASFVVLSGTLELWHLYLAMGLLAAGNAGIGDVVVGAVITRWFDRARGIALDTDYAQDRLAFAETSLPPGMKASMLDDLERGKPLELDWLSGEVSRLGREHGVPTPANDAVYAALKPHRGGAA